MHIAKVNLIGFRNFKKTTINLSETSLILGGNDVGKSNFIHALRLLLDRSLSEIDIEPSDSDFYVHNAEQNFKISIHFENVDQDCVIAKLKEHICEDQRLILEYRAKRTTSGRKTFDILIGRSEESLQVIETRYYLKVLNLKFIGSKRDLKSFIQRERKQLLQDSKDLRDEHSIQADEQKLRRIEKSLGLVSRRINSLSYVNQATKKLNNELTSLSHHNSNHQIMFDAGQSDANSFVENLDLSAQVNGKSLAVGGDGRNNQIQMALWASRNNIIEEEQLTEVNIFCIEEPETHLHPHQQRKLAQYLVDQLKAQVIITTHSPQIACLVPPSSIIRLFRKDSSTIAAGDGVNPFTEAALIDFGYRLNIIPAEAFFADVVLLVEGPSEVLFYKALASAIDIDLDRLNISILMVDGVGFLPYVSLLTSLGIHFVVRTDNDIFKIPKKDAYRFAGSERGLSIATTIYPQLYKKCQRTIKYVPKLRNFSSDIDIPGENKFAARCVNRMLSRLNIFIAEEDLERDIQLNLKEELSRFLNKIDDEEIINDMQKRKATFMFSFLEENSDALKKLEDTSIAKPLTCCRFIAESIVEL